MDTIDVLFVDDEAEFRQASAAALERRGFRVRQAASGAAALELLEARLPDVVVLDLRMAGMDGIETLTEIRRRDQAVPVLILTGHGKFDDVLSGIRLGIVDFVQKPIEIDALAAHIRHLLVQGSRQVLRERTVGELMVPAASYLRIYTDQPVRDAVQALKESLAKGVLGKDGEHGHRCVMVFDRDDDRFVGCLRIGDLIDLVLPGFLRDSPYSSYFTGMFLAQGKLFGQQRIGALLGELVAIELDTPLMEAVYLMSTHRLINLPVVERGNLIGVLRDKDILLELAGQAVGSDG